MIHYPQKHGPDECPSESEIELYVLTHIHNIDSSNTVGSHIESCSSCRTVYDDLCAFYDSLLSNLSKAISNNVLDLMLDTVSNAGRGAVFVLDCFSDEHDNQSSSYHCKLLFDTDKENWKTSMNRLNPHSFKDSDYIIRAFLPSNSQNLILFLWATKPERIRNLRLEFEGLVKVCTTNRVGIALLTKTSLDELDGQIVHTTLRKPSNGYLSNRIKKVGQSLTLWDEQEH